MRRRWERVRGRVTSRNSARVGNPILYGPGMAERSCLITCTTLWGRLQEPRERDSGSSKPGRGQRRNRLLLV